MNKINKQHLAHCIQFGWTAFIYISDNGNDMYSSIFSLKDMERIGYNKDMTGYNLAFIIKPKRYTWS